MENTLTKNYNIKLRRRSGLQPFFLPPEKFSSSVSIRFELWLLAGAPHGGNLQQLKSGLSLGRLIADCDHADEII